MYYRLGRAGRALDRFGVDRVRDHHRPGRARRAAHRQGLRGGAAQQPQQAARSSTTPSCWTRRRPAGSRQFLNVSDELAGLAKVGPDQEPGRHDDDAVPLAADRRALRHRARGDAGPGDRRRDRPPARGRAAGRRRGRQPGPPARPAGQGPRRRPQGPAGPGRDRLRPGRRRRGRRRTSCWTGCSTRPATTPIRRALEDAQRKLVKGLGVPDVRAAPAGRRRRHGRPLRAGRRPPRPGDWHDAAAHPASRARSVGRSRPTAARRSTSTRCSTTPAPASSSAAAPAASARPPRPPRSRCGPPSAAARSWCSPSTRPDGWRSRWASRRSTTPRGRSPGVGGARLARRDDARHEADLRRGRGGAGHPGEGEADPREPLLHRVVVVVRRDAGVHGDGEARPAPARRPRGRHLRPDRRRHAPVALGPGLPRRPRAAVVVPRRPVRPDAARAGPRPGPDHDRRLRAGHRRAVQDPRRPVHHRPADLRRRAGHGLRRLPGPRRSRPTRCCRRPARRSSSWRLRSRTRCARRRTSSSGSARTGCRSPGWS